MFKSLLSSLKFAIAVAACMSARPALAQVTSDGTVNTQVNQNGNVAEITGGETRGGNLFHSFQDFSIPTGNEAFFNNTDNIGNIFSRVTGGNVSNIDGAIRANGNASLFLINPAGIIFGENASLNIGGSFYSSTASNILFEDGEFSAVDNLTQPILTVNAPIGLGFRDNPAEIVNRSFALNSVRDNAGLEVSSGNNLALIGGDLNFNAGNVTARGGNIFLGGLSQAGTVNINQDGSVSFPENLTLADVNLTNFAEVNVAGSGGGNININARNLSLTAGGFGSSFIQAGIISNSTFTELQAGNVTINVTENIMLDNSRIFNQVDPESIGNSGNITINSGFIELTSGSDIDASTFGTGNAGAVNITATGSITVDGENSQGSPSGITSLVDNNAVGDSGGVTISTTNLNLTDGGRVDATTFGTGNAGAIDITATEDITVDGENSQGSPSGITSGVNTSAVGDAGGITISTINLNLTDGGRVDANTFSRGNAGAINITATGDITADGQNSNGSVSGVISVVNDNAEGGSEGITISTTNLNLTAGGQVNASTFGLGDSGAVNITATGDITADSQNSNGVIGGVVSVIGENAEGDSGGITISTTNLNLTAGGQVAASTLGRGNAGAVNITATGNITADDQDSNSSNTGIRSIVDNNAEGNSGGITISTTNLNLMAGSQVNASTLGQGNSGEINLTATGNITADNQDSNGIIGGVISVVGENAEGDSGGITISTNNLNLTNGGQVAASTFGRGNSGAVNITATGNITADSLGLNDVGSGIISVVENIAEGNSGGITLTTTNLNLTNGGDLDAGTFGRGNAGDVNINASESIFISGIEQARVGISANALFENGNGGNVDIVTDRLIIENNGIIEASNRDFQLDFTPGTGLPGNIVIEANAIELDDGAIGAATQSIEGVRGNVDLQIAEGVTLRNNSFISAEAFGEADGGNLSIDTNFIVAFPDGNNDIIASAEQGQGGNININANALFGIVERPLNEATNDINASSEFSLDGTVAISTPGINPVQGAAQLPSNIVVPQETSQQACQANRELAAMNGLDITGKGGVVPDPKLPLDSLNVTVSSENKPSSTSVIPTPVKTAYGKIQPARGVKVTDRGEVILTSYRTDNAGERIPLKRDC